VTAVAPARSRQRWPLAVAAIAVALAVAIAATVWWHTSGSAASARHRWQPPPQHLLSSLRLQPVPGWKADVAVLGLPPGSTFAKDERQPERWPHPLTTDGAVYLLASSPDQDVAQWWLVGVDVRDGHALFAPVALGRTKLAPECFVNGDAVVCLADDYQAATAWVVDQKTGAVTHTGPTDLRLRPGDDMLSPVQVGNHLLGISKAQGAYGIGPKAETTWFAPGAATAQAGPDGVAFLSGIKGSRGTTLVSLQDGRMLAPEIPETAGLGVIDGFDGGFAADVFTGGESRSSVQFFYPTGHLASPRQLDGQLGGSTGNLVAVTADDGSSGIYGPTGEQLLDVPFIPAGMQLIGTTLYLGASDSTADNPLYRAYDVRTGDEGNTVKIDFGRTYLGTDGSVALRAVVNPNADSVAKAYDLGSGTPLWSIPSTPGSLGRLYLVGDTLLQVSDDGTQLFSLIPPS
jgi:hypothetical protein